MNSPTEPTRNWGLPTNQEIADARDALGLLLPRGQVVELRALNVRVRDERRPHVASGYFDDLHLLAAAACQISAYAQGTFITLNPVNNSLLARAANRIRRVYRDPLTTDADVVSRRRLLVDLDPVRPSGISSTDAEHAAAHARAAHVREWLAQRGWPPPAVIDTGNGAHLIYAIDLPTDDADLVQPLLAALAVQFDDDVVHVDRQTHKPAQMTRVPGSWNCKGDNLPERPHRQVRLLSAPPELLTVSRELIEPLAATAPTSAAPQRLTRGSFNIEAWIDGHGLEVEGPRDWQGGRRWVFRVCPWNPEHTNSSAFIMQLASGAIAAGCLHDSCRGNGWHQLRDLVEPNWRQRSRQDFVVELPPTTHPAVRRAFARAARTL